MAKPHASFSLYLFILFLFPPLFSSNNIPQLESFIHGGCSPKPYALNSTFSSNLNSLLTSLLNSSAHSPYSHFSTISPSPNDVVHGLYQCRGDLSLPDCASCVARSVSLLAARCPSSSGATVQLQGCYVRYDNASFRGVENNNVVFKKFGGPSIRYDEEKTVAREAVLNRLVTSGNGSYRAVGSKDVMGQAQCVGDLSVDRCQECVESAVRLLKRESGNSGNGDMFLAKCYARYSCGGGSGGGYSRSGGGSSNEGIKTFALIVGSLAGIVILVVLFTFICREFAGSSK